MLAYDEQLIGNPRPAGAARRRHRRLPRDRRDHGAGLGAGLGAHGGRRRGGRRDRGRATSRRCRRPSTSPSTTCAPACRATPTPARGSTAWAGATPRVHVEAWQDNRARLFAQATGHFLMPRAMPTADVGRSRAVGAITHRRVLAIALPIVLSNATIPILGAVDTAVVGQLGQAAPIGAVGLGAIILTSIYWVFGFLRMGTTGLVAQARGAGEVAETGALLMRGADDRRRRRARLRRRRRRRSSGPPSASRPPRPRSRRWRGPTSRSASGARRRRSRSTR